MQVATYDHSDWMISLKVYSQGVVSMPGWNTLQSILRVTQYYHYICDSVGCLVVHSFIPNLGNLVSRAVY
jgi:hypothetical protein